MRGIHDPPKMELLADVSMPSRAFDAAFPRPENAFTFIDGDATAGADQASRGFGDAKLHTGAAFAEDAAKDWRRSWRCSTSCSASPCS